MKKRVFAILLALTLALSLLPTAVFATGEDGAAEPQEQQEEVKPEQPQGQPEEPEQPEQPEQPEAKPEEEKEAQEKQEEPAPQPAQSAGEPVVLSGEATEVSTAEELTTAIGNSAVSTVQLTEDITIDATLAVSRTVTLDLNGHVLEMTGSGSVIKVTGNLTLKDSTPTAKHDSTTLPAGGVITGGNASYGGGVYIDGGQFTMTGGSIVGCTATDSGNAAQGGGVYVGADSTFTMSNGMIENCTAEATVSGNSAWGGGVYVGGTFDMSGGSIENCKAFAEYGSVMGGGIRNDGTTTLSGNAEIRNCQAVDGYGGGISDGGITVGSTTIPSHLNISGDVKITGCTDGRFGSDAMFVMKNGTITGGTFDGTVANYGTITGGTFTGKVDNGGTITGGTFTGGITGTGTIIATGSGTETDPYQIGTAEGLKWFRDKVNGGEYGLCAELTADIVLDSNEAWTPIGNSTNNDGTDAYSGTFDGKGYTISGLNVTGNFQHAGLFGITFNATIQNLSVSGSVSASAQRTGGIVGSAACGTTIKNCSNHCNVSNLYPEYSPLTGGIAGAVYGSFEIPGHGDTPPTVYAGAATIIDCYNTGSVHSEYGNSESGNPAIGGISGSNQGTIRNCYNVGSVSCSSQAAYIGSIVGFMPGWSSIGIVENCYYLDGAGLNAVGRNDREGNITKTEPKSAAEFSDGTVLKLLKADRDDSPWDSVSKEWNGMVLPGFTWQNNNHTHTWGKWTSNKDGTHSHTCACGVTETGNCSGGTATCTEKATCSTCGGEYGSVLGHDFTMPEHDDNNHWMKCSRCDAKNDVNHHEWDDGTVTTQPTCTKAGEKTYTCTECGAAKTQTIDATGHKWESEWTSDAAYHWHKCLNDNCDMKDSYAAHSGGTATCTEKAVCSTCKQAYGEVDPNNHVGGEELRNKKDATCTEKGYTGDTYCKGCNTMIKAGAEINALDHDWGKWASNKDGTHTRVCSRDKSHTESGKCSGGKADCCHKAECTVCGGKHGTLDPDNHSDLKHFPAKRATTRAEGNIEYWYCSGCGKYYKDAEATKEITQKDTVIRKRRPSGDSTTTDDKTVKSVKTGDAGIALYVGMAALSLTGGAWLRRKKQ